jgi:hypothetical protein
MTTNALVDADIRRPVTVSKEKCLFLSDVFLDQFDPVSYFQIPCQCTGELRSSALVVTVMEAHGGSAT